MAHSQSELMRPDHHSKPHQDTKTGANALAYRVRGGASNAAPTPNSHLPNSKQNQQQQNADLAGSLRSSSAGNWVVAPVEEEDEEERLQREIKKAKVSPAPAALRCNAPHISLSFYHSLQKKAKKEAKLREWAQEKESKAGAELRQQEEEKKAMKEAGACTLTRL